MPDPASPTPIVAITGGLRLGGSTTFLVNLGLGLRALGQRLVVVCLAEPNEHAADFARAGIEVRTLDRDLIYEDRLSWAYEQIAPLHPRMVLACLGAESFEVLRLAPPGVRRIGVIQAHHPLPYETAARYVAWLDGIAGVSEEIAAELRARADFARLPVHTIPYGIAFPPPAPRAPRAPGKPLRVVYLGRLIEEQKRISRIVELARRCEDMRFTLIGSGPQEAEVRAQLADARHVSILGALHGEEASSHLRAADVFLLLSDYEGLPLALLEAMGAGLVPVVSDLPSGMAQAVPDGCGVRVPVGDLDAAHAALRTLADDPAHLAQLSRAAEAHARSRFTAERMAADYFALADTTPTTAPAWPSHAEIPAPLGVSAWMFRGWPRRLRRWLKPWLASRRAPSSRA